MGLLCSGCAPFYLQDTPHVSGTVFSDTTKQPIADARLHYERYPRKFVQTSGDGQFDFPSLYHWHIMPLAPTDRFDREKLLIAATNYAPQSLYFGHWGDCTNTTIYLKPQ
jgi:hypothetical protein